jgi:hypothetical protein
VEHDDAPTSDPRLAEYSRPRRQYNEDRRKHNKPCGRKRKHDKRDAKYVNWQAPTLWSQIEAATRRAPRGRYGAWSPRAILNELRKSNPKDFFRLTEQVIGRWIDASTKNKWTESVLQVVARGSGNSPGGHTTRCGVLVSTISILQYAVQTLKYLF